MLATLAGSLLNSTLKTVGPTKSHTVASLIYIAGNYDLVGLNFPVFFVRDPFMGPDNIRRVLSFIISEFVADVLEGHSSAIPRASSSITMRGSTSSPTFPNLSTPA